jgi:hypothetical protein
MKKFNIGLKVSEQVQFVLLIAAKNLREAKETWAWLTGHWDPFWDIKNQTYGGWKVVKTKIEALQRKDCKLSRWSY